MEKQLIVGIDPGTTVGLAFLDIDGNILDVRSARSLAIEDIITEIASIGTAVVIASDKAITPPVVNKLSGILGARLFNPDVDISIEKKRELAAGWETQNDHERDSLAAAVYAYYNFQNKIRRVEKQVMDELDEIKARVLKGEKVSDIMAPAEEANKERGLQAQITALRKENRELKAENESLARAHPRQPHALLREATREAKGIMLDVTKGELVLLRDVPSLNYSDLKNVPIKKGDYVFCKNKEWDNNGLRFLESKRVGAVITPATIESLAPNCGTDDLGVCHWEGLFFANPYDIEKRCGRRKEVKSRDLLDMLQDYKKGRR